MIPFSFLLPSCSSRQHLHFVSSTWQCGGVLRYVYREKQQATHRRLRKNSAHKNSCPFAVLEFPLPEESVPRFWEGYRHGLEPAALEPYSITGQGCGVQQLLYLLWLRERFMDTRVLFKSIRKVCLTRVRTGWKSGVEKCASTKMVKNWVLWGLLGQIYKAQALWN